MSTGLGQRLVTGRTRSSAWLGDRPDLTLILSSFVLLIVLVVTFSFTAERFFTPAVAVNILTHASLFVIAGVGMTIVLTMGAIDISIGSIIGVIATVMGITMTTLGWPAWAGLLAAVAVGAACGLLNGFLFGVIRVPAIIVTLGTMTFFRGIAYILGRGEVYMRFPEPVTWLGTGRIAGIPVPVVIAAVTVAFGYVFLTHSRAGRHIVAVGGNEEAARLAGIDVVAYKVLTFVIMGLLAAVTAIVIVARQDASQAVMGTGFELQVIAAVVLGGTSLFGGRGVVLGTVLGALIIGVLQTGLLLSGVVYFWQLVALGMLIVVVVALRVARETSES